MPTQLMVHSDGKIILLGLVGDDPFKRQTVVTRFNANGSPDLIFGNKIFPDIDMEHPAGCVQADGKFLVLVNRLNSSTVEREVVLHRLLSNGDPDGAFGGQGFITVRFNDEDSEGKSVAVTDDGKILVGGTVKRGAKTTKAIGRLFPSGALDSSFARSGYWESATDLKMGRMIVDGNDIICVGNAALSGGSVACVSRVTGDGDTDPTFNSGNAFTIDIPADFPGLYVICRSVAVQSDKSIVFGGEAGNIFKAYVGRVLSNGTIDSSFGVRGLFVHDKQSLLFDLNIQANEQRVLAAVDLGEIARQPQVLGIQL